MAEVRSGRQVTYGLGYDVKDTRVDIEPFAGIVIGLTINWASAPTKRLAYQSYRRYTNDDRKGHERHDLMMLVLAQTHRTAQRDASRNVEPQVNQDLEPVCYEPCDHRSTLTIFSLGSPGSERLRLGR